MDLDTIQAGGGGIPGALARAALRVASGGWWLAWQARRALRAAGLRRSRALPVPVISVGNLAVGGTGKTPFVTWLAARLRAEGHRPGLLARGYGARAASDPTLSDEGAVRRHALGDDVPQREAPDRVAAGRALLAAHPEVDVLLLDDGFQHGRLRRDLDVVLLDATRPFGHGHLLPRGRLREPPAALARADLVVLSRTELVDDAARAAVRREVARWTSAPVVEARTRPEALLVAGRPEPPGALAGVPVFIACALGHPAAFRATLEALGARVVGSVTRPDHAPWGDAAWTRARQAARDAGARWLVTTRKDAVKRPRLEDDVAVLEVGVEIVSGEDALREALRRTLAAPRSP